MAGDDERKDKPGAPLQPTISDEAALRLLGVRPGRQWWIDSKDAGESEETRMAVLLEVQELVLRGVNDIGAVDRVLCKYGLERISKHSSGQLKLDF